MRCAISIAALLAVASASVVVRQDKQTVPQLGGPAQPSADRKCTKSGEKCAGSVGNPLVEYKECCDERLQCGVPKDLPDTLWGQFCILPADIDKEATAAAVGGSGATQAPSAGGSTTAAPTETDKDGNAVTTAPTETDADGNAVTTVPTETDADGNAVTTVAATVTDKDGSTVTTASGDAATKASDADAKATNDEDDGSVCFPADATVELEDGSVVPMAELSIGDVVKVGVNKFSKVFMFTHKMADVTHKFVTLSTSSGAELSLTKGHYLYADGALVAASQVKVGSTVTLGNGAIDTVIAVGSKTASGLYNPQTVNGDVVVNGIVSSTYTTAVEPSFAHAILAPFRFMNALGLQFTALESGGGVLADVAPRGQAAF